MTTYEFTADNGVTYTESLPAGRTHAVVVVYAGGSFPDGVVSSHASQELAEKSQRGNKKIKDMIRWGEWTRSYVVELTPVPN